MPELSPAWQLIIAALITGFGTWYATHSGNQVKIKELARSEQKEFMETVLEELDEMRQENKLVKKELDQVRDQVRDLIAAKAMLEREREDYLRVLRRVAACQVAGCPNLSRAAEFLTPIATGGTP